MPAHRRRRKKRQFTLSRDLIRRLLFVIPFVIVAGLATVSVSGANIFRAPPADRPDFAMAFQPSDARAHARAAQKLFGQTERGAARFAEVERLALDALRRDPTVVPAWSLLGTVAIARNQPARAAAMFRFSSRLSHRDLATQLWLIEERVQANDIPGALAHYDTALRASDDAYPVLFPILVAATANDGIVPPLARLLNTGPPWRRAFIERLVAGPPPDPERFVRLTGMIAGSLSAEEKNVVAMALPGLVERRQYRPALALYGQLAAAPRGAPLLRNGGFDQDVRYPPLDWQLTEGTEFGARQEAFGESGRRLQIFGASGTGGTAARQLLLLPPGAYEISVQTGAESDVRPARLNWTIQCGDAEGTPLLRQDLPVRAAPGRFGVRFHVPGGPACVGQWLAFNLVADFDQGGAAAWIDAVTLRPLAGGQP
jgi:tetratricopeptide (TPR) repeat protein